MPDLATELQREQNDNDLFKNRNVINRKITQTLFICDILKSVKHEMPNVHYELFNIKFNYVKFSGTIVTCLKETDIFSSYLVDDGTGVIECIYNKCLKIYPKNNLSALKESIIKQPTNQVQKAINKLITCSRYVEGKIKEYENLTVGDTVCIIGRLSVKEVKKNVYINNIYKMRRQDETNNILKTIQEYKNYIFPNLLNN